MGSKVFRGQPMRRFWQKVGEPTEQGCLPWLGSIAKGTRGGYGNFRSPAGPSVRAHRWIYEQTHGPIPDGLVVDHECHNRDASCPGGPECPHRRCVNVDHLTLATPGQNSRSGKAGAHLLERTHCPQGHPYDEENTVRWPPRYSRACRTCANSRALARYHARKKVAS